MGGDAIGDLLVPGIGRVQQGGVHLGGHVAGSDGVYVDAPASPLVAQGLGQQGDAPLGGGVGGDGEAAEEGLHGGDVDDLAISLLQHLPARQLAQLKGGGEVDLQHGVPVLHGELLAGVAALDAGAVDQDVDLAAQQLQGAGESGPQALPVSQVGGHAVAGKAPAPERLRHSFHLLRGAPDDHLGPGLHQSLGHAPAQAPGSAGHNGLAALNIK